MWYTVGFMRVNDDCFGMCVWSCSIKHSHHVLVYAYFKFTCTNSLRCLCGEETPSLHLCLSIQIYFPFYHHIQLFSFAGHTHTHSLSVGSSHYDMLLPRTAWMCFALGCTLHLQSVFQGIIYTCVCVCVCVCES